MLNLFIYHMDIVDAYLESLLDDNKLPIFMKLLPGMHNLRQIQKSLLYRLLRSLYGLKQSGRLWNHNIIVFYKRICFRQLNRDASSPIHHLGGEISVVSVYVDNFLLVSNIMSIFNALK